VTRVVRAHTIECRPGDSTSVIPKTRPADRDGVPWIWYWRQYFRTAKQGPHIGIAAPGGAPRWGL